MERFWYNYTIINCLLTIFVHNYYAQPIYYIDASKWSESLTDWSIPLSVRSKAWIRRSAVVVEMQFS